MLLLPAVVIANATRAADSIGGSIGITSDYVVRGISRSNQEPAVQADLHVITDRGLLAGLFMSNVQFDAGDKRSAELGAFAGFAWQASSAWRMKTSVSYYGYVGNDSGSRYDYAELNVEAAYSEWLDLNAEYSPDAPRSVYDRVLTRVAQKSTEVVARTPWRHHLSVSAGFGYSDFGGPGGCGYAYWSAGGVLDLAPASLSISYFNAGAGAAALFDGAAVRKRWIATLIWRF